MKERRLHDIGIAIGLLLSIVPDVMWHRGNYKISEIHEMVQKQTNHIRLMDGSPDEQYQE